MNYDWKLLAPEDVTGFAEEAGYLTRRVAEMSPKEWRIFRAALGMNPQKDLAGMAAVTHRLHTFDYYFPVTDDAELGRQLAIYTYNAGEEMLPYLDFEKIGAGYRNEQDGEFLDGAFISQANEENLGRLEAMAENIRARGIPEEDGWTAKLRIAGPNGEESWLRLPDCEETTGQPDEVATALRDLGAESLYECELLEAKCALPGIDLTARSSSLRKLVFDASSLGHTLREEGSHDRHFMDKLKAALAYENCDRLDFARDIVDNLACYDFIPESELKSTAERIMPEGHFGQPVLLGAFDYEAFAGDYHHSKGMRQVDGGFFMRNNREFQFEHSTSPTDQMAETERQSLAVRLDEAFDRCWREYEAGLCEQAPESLIHMSEQIALTRAALNGFRDGRGLSPRMMETLLSFENPLDIARDAWQVCTGSDTPEVVGHYLQTLLDDPNIEEYYGPRLEPQGHPAEPELRME